MSFRYETTLPRVRRLLWFGAFTVLVAGWTLLGWSAAGLELSAAEWAALLLFPVSWAGVPVALVTMGSDVRRRWLWVSVLLVLVALTSFTAAVVLKPTLSGVAPPSRP